VDSYRLISVLTDVRSDKNVFLVSVCLFSVFLPKPCIYLSVHQSDKVPQCVRMKDLSRQMKRKRKRQIEGKKQRELTYVCLFWLCLFVSRSSVALAAGRAH